MNRPSENPVQPQQPQTQFQNLQANAQMHVTANIPGNLSGQDRPPYCPEQSPPASVYPSAVNGYAGTPYQAPYGGNPYAAYPLQGQQVTTVYYTGSGYNGQNTPAVQPPAAPSYPPPAAPPQETIPPYGSPQPYHQPVSYGQGGYRPVPQDPAPAIAGRPWVWAALSAAQLSASAVGRRKGIPGLSAPRTASGLQCCLPAGLRAAGRSDKAADGHRFPAGHTGSIQEAEPIGKRIGNRICNRCFGSGFYTGHYNHSSVQCL